jgi:hypothetical protein
MAYRLPTEHLVWDRHEGKFVRASSDIQADGFLKGPIPLDWLSRCRDVSSAAFILGIAAWHSAALHRRQDDLPLTPSILRPFRIAERTKFRVLMQLEAAGLLTVVRERGCSPRVSLVTERST